MLICKLIKLLITQNIVLLLLKSKLIVYFLKSNFTYNFVDDNAILVLLILLRSIIKRLFKNKVFFGHKDYLH